MSYLAWFSLHISTVIILPLSGMLTSPEMRAPRGPERSVPGTPGPLLLSTLWSWSRCLWIFFIQDDRSSLLAVGEQRENATHWLTMPAVAWFCLHDKFCDHAFYLYETLCCLQEKLHFPRPGWLPPGQHRDWLLPSFWNDLGDDPGERGIYTGPRNKDSLYSTESHTDTALERLLVVFPASESFLSFLSLACWATLAKEITEMSYKLDLLSYMYYAVLVTVYSLHLSLECNLV